MTHTPPRTRPIARLGVAALASLAVLACQTPEPEPATGQPAPGGMILRDTDISATVMAANTGEIQEGQLALTKSQNTAVREFAQRMVTEHTQLNQMFQRLQGDIGAPTSNTLSQQLMTTAEQTTQALQQMQGADFDRAYISNQVAIHEWLLRTLDEALIPGARDSDLERELRTEREWVAAHLEHARQVQASLMRD